jgi:HK97 family phage portal protein
MVVNKIAKTSSTIKRIVVDSEGDPIENSEIGKVLAAPNSEQNTPEFLQSINESVLLSGNAFIHRVEGIGMGMELKVWNPGGVEIKTNKVGQVIKYVYKDADGRKTTVTDVDTVLHIRTSNVAQCRKGFLEWGISPLQALWIVVKASNEKFNAEASIFKNRGIIGILTNKSDVPMLPNERKRLQDEFDAESGGADKFNKIKISTTDLNYIQTGMSPTDLKLLEGILSSLRLVAAAYGMPSVLFNDNATSTYNNIVEAKKSAFTDAYLPICELVDTKLSAWLSDFFDVQEFIVPDLTSIEELRNTTNKLMTNLNSLDPTVARTLSAALRINDVLEMLGLDPMGAEGEKPLGSGKQNETSNSNEAV